MKKKTLSLILALVLAALVFSLNVFAASWSDWTTDTTKLSDSRYQSESKTQYATRTKQTTTSSSSSLAGWTRDDSKTTYTVSWGATTYYDYQRSTSDTLRYVGTRSVATGTQTYLYRYYSPSENSFATYKKNSSYVEDGYWVYNYYSYDKYRTGQALYMSDEIRSYASDYPCWKGSTRSVTKTQYGYQSGTKNYTYSFYKWSDWSNWQDGSRTASDSVKTRTLYRYRLKDTQTIPTASLSATNNVAASQTVTLSMSDDSGVVGYYWGTNSTYSSNPYTKISSSESYSAKKTVSSAGTYYLVAKNAAGKVSSVKSITFYKTTLNANGGTVSASSVLTKKGSSFTLPTPKKGRCAYKGWSTDKSALSGVKTLSPTANGTYYAIWGNTSASAWTQSNQYSFSNSSMYFKTGVYTMKDREFNKLCNYINKVYEPYSASQVINSIVSYKNSQWGGSCYGMSLSAILNYTGQADIDGNFGAGKASLYSVSAPNNNADIQSAINYYHMTQKIPFISNSYKYYEKNTSAWSTGLRKLVESAKNGDLISFLYFWDTYGHAVTIVGYNGTDSAGNYLLKTYDNRFPQQYINVVISSSYSSCIVGGNENAQMVGYTSDFDVYDKVDIDGSSNNMVINKTASGKKALKGANISVKLNANVTVHNNDGKSIVIKKGKVTSSDVKILSKYYIVNSTAKGDPAPAQLVLNVEDSESFSFESSNGSIDASVLNKNGFTAVTASSAEAAVVSSDEGVYLIGDSVKYKIYSSADDTFDMFSFSGKTDGNANINYSGGKVTVTGNAPGSITVGRFNGADCEEMTFNSSKSNVSVDMTTCKTHKYKTTVTTKATFSKDGKMNKICKVCGHKVKNVVIPKLSSVKLSSAKCTYNGKVKTPSVTAKNRKGTVLKKNTDYTVKYASGRKAVGTYKVTVTFKGKYSGSKTLSFKINPKATAFTSLTPGYGKATLKYKAVSGVTGYEIWYYSTSSKKYVKDGTSTKTTYSFTGLSHGKTYKVKVRTYKTVSGTKYYSSFSPVKSVKAK